MILFQSGGTVTGRGPAFFEYEPYEPEFGLVRNALTPARARKAFTHDMAVKDERLAIFARYARSFGVSIGYEDADLDAVYHWLAGIVTLDPSVDLVAATTGDPWLNTEPLILDSMSLSLAWDFGIFLGEAKILRFPSLTWELGAGTRRYVNFQRPSVGHYVYPNGHRKQWPVMWTAQASLEGAAVGELDTALVGFINYWPEGG